MITFSRLGEKGNLGNQLFQIASTIGIAEKYGHDFFFPEWNYSKYFKKQLPVYYKDESYKFVKEKLYNYYEWELGQGNFDIFGWIQSEKYFDIGTIKKFFQFGDFSENLYYKYDFLFKKKTILISVRRGDFVNHPHYYQLSYLFYLKAIIKNFPDWKERNLIFASDNIKYCKYHFSFLKNSFFLDDLSAIEQLALGVNCDDFVISNSTFSWWIAWLGEKSESKVIRPIKNFRGEFAKQNNDSDYFPERWISFDDNEFDITEKYHFLTIRGFVYDFFVNSKFFYFQYKKQIKKIIMSCFGE